MSCTSSNIRLDSATVEKPDMTNQTARLYVSWLDSDVNNVCQVFNKEFKIFSPKNRHDKRTGREEFLFYVNGIQDAPNCRL